MKKVKCACKGTFLDKFIQPAILTALMDGPLHGFSILKKLNADGLLPGDPDPTGLYRTLKKMEAAGLLSSDWEMGENRKPRRIYEITGDGRDCLGTWRATLCAYQQDIASLIGKINEKIPPDAPCGCCCSKEEKPV